MDLLKKIYFLLADGESPRLFKYVEWVMKPQHLTSVGNIFVIQTFLIHYSRRSSYFSNLRRLGQLIFSSKGTVNSAIKKLSLH